MTYGIEIKPAARKVLASLPRWVGQRLDESILSLADNPRGPGTKPLQGQWKGLHRIRVGNHRIIYLIEDGRLIVTVIKIGDHRDIYDQ